MTAAGGAARPAAAEPVQQVRAVDDQAVVPSNGERGPAGMGRR